MHWAWDILLVVLAIASGGCAAYYAVVWARAVYAARTLPTARDGLSLPAPAGGWPSVCIIIPAHNEQDVIADLARSLRAQDYPGFRVVFCLDRCTDNTERVLRAALRAESGVEPGKESGDAIDPRFEILTVTSCPDDWAGKTHAVWRGVQDSAGARGAELLLFTDADTIFKPGLVRASVALLRARDLHMLSLLSTLTLDHWYEKFVQPAAGLELIRQFPLDRVARGTSAFANGQFMLFRRDAYDAIGGHESVKHRLLEDLALSRRMVRRHGMRVHTLMGDGVLVCRMYRSWDAFIRGWKRIYTEAARGNAARMRQNALRLRAVGTGLPAASFVCAATGALLLLLRVGEAGGAGVLLGAGVLGLLAFGGAIARVYRSQHVPLRYAIAYPLAAWRAARLLSAAACDVRKGRATRWGGRAYSQRASA